MRTSFLVSALAIISTTIAQFSSEQCGPSAGNQRCGSNKCCSQYGWCGTTDAYCVTGCQTGFGACKGVTPSLSRSSSSARPSSTPSIPVGTSTDKCGPNNNNLICAPSYCCSQYGYCGKTTAYCAKGCQSGFGTCSDSASSLAIRSSSTRRSSSMGTPRPSASSTPARSSTALSSALPSSSSGPVSTNSRCGASFGRTTCQGSTYGNCCSQYNYCGNSRDHCNAGCQPGFGTCAGASSSSSIIRSSSQRSSASSSSQSSSSVRTVQSASSASSLVLSSSSRSSGLSSSASGSASISSSVLPSSNSASLSQSVSSSAAPSVVSSSGTVSAISHTTISAASSSLPSSSVASVGSSSISQTYISGSSASVASSSSHLASSSAVVSSSLSSGSVSASASVSSAASSGSASPIVSLSSAASSGSVSASASVSSAASSVSASPSVSVSSHASSSMSSVVSSASVTPSTTPVPAGFSSDPLSNPNAVEIEKPQNVQSQTVNDPANAPPGGTGRFLSLSTTDGNGAAVTVITRPDVQSGTAYTISVWLKALTASSRCAVTVKVDGVTVGGPYEDITTQWREYTARYTATGTTSPLLALAVDCSGGGTRRLRFKRDAGDGLAMGDLAMEPNNTPVVVSSSAVVVSSSAVIVSSSAVVVSSSAVIVSSSDVVVSSSAVVSASATSSLIVIPTSETLSSASLSPSSSLVSEIASTSSPLSEIVSTSSSLMVSVSSENPASASSAEVVSTTQSSEPGSTSTAFSSEVIASSTVPTITTAPPSSTVAIPTGCTPTIVDGGFENFVAVVNPQAADGAGSSNDWSVNGEWFEKDGGWFGGVGFGPSYSGGSANVYNAFTNSTMATTYDIKYKHPLNLCAGTSYDVSGWTRTQYATGSRWNAEGCRMTAFLDGQEVFTDRIGYWDYPKFRYVHGVMTPTADTVAAELFFRVACKIPQRVSARGRGIKLDEVAVVPISQWSLPAAAEVPTNTISPNKWGTDAGVYWPEHTACVAADINPARTGCVMYGNQVANHDFETCSSSDWIFSDLQNNGVNGPEDAGQLDYDLTGIFTDEVHSGQKSMRIVLKQDGGGARLWQYVQPLRVCAERSYKWSFWVKQATANACDITLAIGGGAYQGVALTSGTSWTQFEGAFSIGSEGAFISGGDLTLDIVCSSGGMNHAVWVDDFNVVQV